MVTVDAPIDRLPLFVRAGSIIPMGSKVESTEDPQTLTKVEVWPGRNADFTLYQDDGTTYAYEHGDYKVTHLHWDEAAQKLTHTGAPAWAGPDDELVDVIR